MLRSLVALFIIVVVSVELAVANPCVGPAGSPCVDDGNPCTDDICDGLGTCTHPNNTAPCDDSDACTVNVCAEGVCVLVGPLNCDDTNVCTDDRCDSDIGCINTNNVTSCDDGNACTTDDACEGGGCVGRQGINCADENPCTDDGCNPESGCTHVNNAATCNDGDACTRADVCLEGTCVPGPAVDCNDANACTNDSCVPATGCIHEAVPSCCNVDAECADADQCTMNERCVGHACRTDPVACGDSNPCTDDRCEPGTGCVHTNNALPCNDNNLCTTVDRCADGACVGQLLLYCDDRNACTRDGCDPGYGCYHVNNVDPCNDGLFCTVGDACAGGVCVGAPRDCGAASDQCHVGICDETQDQCVGPAKPDGTACNDGTVCTTGETCVAGRCTDGTPVTCSGCEACEATVGCQTGPRPACHVSIATLKSKLQIDDRPGTASDAVSWKFMKGDQTSVLELRDPLASNDFRLCIFDRGGTHLALRTDVPAGGMCDGKQCWKALGTRGFRYGDPARKSDGVLKLIVLTGSVAGSMHAQLKAKGDMLPPLLLPLAMPVVAQLESASGYCWKTPHGASGLVHNDARQFRALGD